MTIVSVGAIAPPSVVGGNFTRINLSTVSFTAGNWNGGTPENLQAIADGNPSTVTTWGRTNGAGNKGWIQADLGRNLNRLYLELQLGVRMDSNWNSGEATWTIEASSNTNFFFALWQGIRIRPTSTEQILQLSLWGSFRYLRVTSEDVGAGQAELRWYDLKMWQMNI